MPPLALEEVGALAAEGDDVGVAEGEAAFAPAPRDERDSDPQGEAVEQVGGPAVRG